MLWVWIFAVGFWFMLYIYICVLMYSSGYLSCLVHIWVQDVMPSVHLVSFFLYLCSRLMFAHTTCVSPFRHSLALAIIRVLVKENPNHNIVLWTYIMHICVFIFRRLFQIHWLESRKIQFKGIITQQMCNVMEKIYKYTQCYCRVGTLRETRPATKINTQHRKVNANNNP